MIKVPIQGTSWNEPVWPDNYGLAFGLMKPYHGISDRVVLVAMRALRIESAQTC